MELKIIIDKNRKEEINIYAHSRNALIDQIEELVNNTPREIIGYCDEQVVKVPLNEIFCFTIEKGKLYCITEKEKFLIKQRLYQIEELIDKDFIKINQSSVANIRKIERFDASFGGSLMVIFKNGYKDYVSRRQIKLVKERIGF